MRLTLFYKTRLLIYQNEAIRNIFAIFVFSFYLTQRLVAEAGFLS